MQQDILKCDLALKGRNEVYFNETIGLLELIGNLFSDDFKYVEKWFCCTKCSWIIDSEWHLLDHHRSHEKTSEPSTCITQGKMK